VYDDREAWNKNRSDQHSMHLTGGILRVFWQFSTPQQNLVFEPQPHPVLLPLTQAVGWLKNKSNFMQRYSLTQIPPDCKVIGELSKLK